MMKYRRHFSIVGKVLVAIVSLVLAREYFHKEVFLEFINNPSLCLLLIAMWILNQFLVCWRLEKLFSLVNCRIPYFSLVRATFISLLFTSVLPGVVGADLAKIVLIKNVNPDKRLSLVGSGIFLDRVLGLTTLVLISAVASIFLPFATLTGPQRQMVYVVWALSAALSGGWLGCMIIQRWFATLELGHHIPGYRFKIVRRGIEMIRLWRLPLKDQLAVLAISIVGLSALVVPQALIAGYLLEKKFSPETFALMVFIFPALTVISALPITPLGLGVGQLAVGEAFKIFSLPAAIGVAVTTLSQITQAFVSFVCGGAVFWFGKSKGYDRSPEIVSGLNAETR